RGRKREYSERRRCWYRPWVDGLPAGSPTASDEFARCNWRYCGLRFSRSYPDSRRTMSSYLWHAPCWDSDSAASGPQVLFFSASRFARNLVERLSGSCSPVGLWDGEWPQFFMLSSLLYCRFRQHGVRCSWLESHRPFLFSLYGVMSRSHRYTWNPANSLPREAIGLRSLRSSSRRCSE